MLKFVLKFLPLIVHELADILFDHLAEKQKERIQSSKENVSK
jgi:hypothetical protein